MRSSVLLLLVVALYGVECVPFGSSDDAIFDELFGGSGRSRQEPPAFVRAALASRLGGGYGGYGRGLEDLLPTMHCEEGTYECGRSITERVHVGDDQRPQFLGGPVRAFIDKAPVFCHPGSKGCGVHINYHIYLNPKPLGGVWERSLGDAKIFRARRGPPIVCADGNCGGRSRVMVHGQDAVALKPSHMEQSDVYSFAIHGASIESYDPEEGHVDVDFHKGLVEEVCKVAGKKCVGFYDTADHCFSHGTDAGPHAGIGLLDGWFDGCLGWADNPFRHLSVDFSDPYIELKNTDAKFYVARENPLGFDISKLADYTIGILTPWATDYHCLRHHHNDLFTELTRDRIKFATHKVELRRMIVKGEVDAGFVNGIIMDPLANVEGMGIEAIDEPLHCPANRYTDKTTIHMITRRGSDVIPWWNDAFQKFKDSGRYYRLCRDAIRTGQTPGCLD